MGGTPPPPVNEQPNWRYSQRSGELTSSDARLSRPVTGYAGHGEGVNNPAMEHMTDIGPLPKGRYKVTAIYRTHDDRRAAGFSKNLGPVVVHLEPQGGTETHNRGHFRVHGDNSRGDRSASNGCIIMPRAVREKFRVDDILDVE
eukprot:m.112947 g.112947  ORF g.112947 m.112947 type:complete len:144 (+) comp12994_c0_seq1:851-1282(+)